jgi:hypothetical protein
LALAVLAAGCSRIVTDVGPPLPQRTSLDLAPGHDAIRDVLASLGPPAQISAAAGGGCVMLYEHNAINENQLGFDIPYGIPEYFKLVYARATLEHDCWAMTFDPHGTLIGWGEERHRIPFGSGFALQFLVSAKGLVDTSEISVPATQHRWGMASLCPLPQVLNTAQSLTSGADGLEQTPSPPSAGQHTLDMEAR